MQEVGCMEETYQLVPLRQQDIELIRVWRNAQRDVLRQTEILTEEAQKAYFAKFVWPHVGVRYPPQILYSFLSEGECIGYGGFTHIDWKAKRAELSFLLDPERVKDPEVYKKNFLCFLGQIRKEAHEIWGLHRIFTETFAFRRLHIQVLEQFGFERENILHQRVYKRGEWTDSFIHEIRI